MPERGDVPAIARTAAETGPAKALTIVAFDFGLRRIGVAVGQSRTATASPIGIVANGDAGPDHGRISALLGEWQPDRLIVGLPGAAPDGRNTMDEAIHHFIEDLARYAIPVDTVDERLTSREAERTLKRARRAGSRGRIQKEHIDAAAAVLIAERYLANSAA